MDCSYCYIYHGQDDSWKKMPRLMPSAVLDSLVNEVADLYLTQQFKPQLVFHGGEPLLFGIRRLHELVSMLVQRVPEISLSIQTNGTIYNKSLEQLLLEFRSNLTFSVSVDGFQPENDLQRRGLRDESVYDRIGDTLKRSLQAGVLDNILMVVDIRNDPNRIYQFMVASGAKSYNILLQDGDHDHLPPGKSFPEETTVGSWLWDLFKIYSAGPQKFRIKFFDDLSLSLLKKARGIQTPRSTFSLCTVTIDTNGEIKQADTFRINSNGADTLTGQNILTSTIRENLESPSNKASVEAMEDLCEKCQSCTYLNVCGGGFPSHRSKGYDLKNPSIYCADYLHLFERVEKLICQ